MIAYKGFDKKLQCLGFQYELGKDYEHTGTVSMCNSGFHSCANPLDVLRYYGPATSRYAEVEPSGTLEEKSGEDSKVASSKLHIGAELSLSALIGLGVKFVLDRTKTETKGAQATSGYYSPAATS